MIFALEADTMPTVGSLDLTTDEFAFGLAFKRIAIRAEGCTSPSNAGADQQVDDNIAATLVGSASSDDVGIISYLWTQTLGSSATTIALLKNKDEAKAWLENLDLPYLIADKAGNISGNAIKS